MPADLSVLLAEFARACKAAARAVSLYPGTHPAIGSSLTRLVTATGRLTANGRVVCTVHPDLLAIEGQAPVRPDASIGELASLLHDRLIGELTIQREADADDWRTLLLLLARAPEARRRSGIASSRSACRAMPRPSMTVPWARCSTRSATRSDSASSWIIFSTPNHWAISASAHAWPLCCT